MRTSGNGGEAGVTAPADIQGAPQAQTVTLLYSTDNQQQTIGISQNMALINPDEDGTKHIAVSCEKKGWALELFGDAIAYDYGASEYPFVYYYYNGELDQFQTGRYAFFGQDVKELGFEYKGKPVKLIKSTYVENGSEEERNLIFVGFEYDNKKDGADFGRGLLGFQLSVSLEEPTEEELISLFKTLFAE